MAGTKPLPYRSEGNPAPENDQPAVYFSHSTDFLRKGLKKTLLSDLPSGM
jgi:hypothetical protein